MAMLPASMGVMTAAAATQTAAAVQAMPDCEHHQHMHKAPVKQTQKSAEHDACISNCAMCFGFVSADAVNVSYTVLAGAALTPALEPDDLSSLMGTPPFRPPRA